MRTEKRTLSFVRALISGGAAKPTASGLFRITVGSKSTSLGKKTVEELISNGVLLRCEQGCNASPLARNWIRREMSETGDPAVQHRRLVQYKGEAFVNLNESPLARLAISINGAGPFLTPHQVESGERFRRLFERANMIQRTTMSYDPDRVPGSSPRTSAVGDLSEMAIDARRELDQILSLLPRDCAGAIMDICGFLKGLQTVEKERQWPRRSAKLVLRVGLEQLAQHFGLTTVATGSRTGRSHFWVGAGARPDKLE